MINFEQGIISSIFMTGLAVYGFITGIGTVVGEIAPDIGIPTTIGGFIFALLTAIFRQGNVINNIDKNIEKTNQSMDKTQQALVQSLEILKQLLNKYNEQNEILSKHNMICHKEDEYNKEKNNKLKIHPITLDGNKKS